VRLEVAVGSAAVGECCAGRQIAVLEQLDGFGDTSGTEVDRPERIDAGLAGPGDELVGTELVRLDRPPGQVQLARALVLRTDAILPVVVGDEVAAGVADRSDTQLTNQFEHVGTEPVLVGARVVRLVDTGVDAAAHVLDERAEQAPVQRTDHEGGVDGETCDRHLRSSSTAALQRLT
jgi:hypothetical protein